MRRCRIEWRRRKQCWSRNRYPKGRRYYSLREVLLQVRGVLRLGDGLLGDARGQRLVDGLGVRGRRRGEAEVEEREEEEEEPQQARSGRHGCSGTEQVGMEREMSRRVLRE
jgi:hypothetical protein